MVSGGSSMRSQSPYDRRNRSPLDSPGDPSTPSRKPFTPSDVSRRRNWDPCSRPDLLTPEVLRLDLPSGRVESVPRLQMVAERAMDECNDWSPRQVDPAAG